MNEIKYTTDGKKVIVIGNLNNQEKIVQEIYICNGAEIPQGENFVVKSLLDAPVKSWKEERIAEIETRYKKEYDARVKEMDELTRKHRLAVSLFKEKISFVKSASEKINPETFDLLSAYICNEIKYVVIDDTKIVEFKDFKQDYDGKLRLISIFGKDDGSLQYKVGEYYDYSGSHRKFTPCMSYEEAINTLTEYINSKDTYSDYDLKSCKEYNIAIDPTKLEAYKAKRRESILKDIEYDKNKLAETETKLKELEQIA